jgi:hypothetical protein
MTEIHIKCVLKLSHTYGPKMLERGGTGCAVLEPRKCGAFSSVRGRLQSVLPRPTVDGSMYEMSFNEGSFFPAD